jgi:hypothetical protein
MRYAYKLFDQLINTYDVYKPILEDIYGENPFTSSILSNAVEEIQQYFMDFIEFAEPVYGVQYIYDFIRDLTLAYNEFKEVAFDLAAICCPDMTRFPKHLLLGEACEFDGECERSAYRHYFVASPVLNNQQEKLEKVKFLHKRLVLMIEQFSISRIRDEGELKIKVTPSKEKMGYLSQRTIPFYYDTKQESEFENLTTLEKNWDYEVFRKCISSDDPLQMSYDNHSVGRSAANPVSNPLGFDLDQFIFFRVEGIQGKPLKEVTSSLMELRYQTNLPFNIKAVYFGDLVEEEFREECAFADLQPSYSIWRNKALLFINNLVRTNKNAETIVLNRDELYNMGTRDFASFGSSSAKKSAGNSRNEKSSFSGTSEKKTLFNLGNLSRMMSMRENLDFGNAASEISNINMTLGNIMSGAEISRSAAFESSRDNSIRGLFDDLNNCLLNMIQAMPNDFRAFDMQEWLKHYKCAMRMYINTMKFLASETTNALGMIIMHIVLIILCILFRLLRFISIYPYITIRILYDTAQERLERLQTSYQFSRFLREHPGIEHQAGAAPGHTLILVYQLEHLLEEKDIELGIFGDGSFFK